MTFLRFYVRNADGSLEGDETCVVDTVTVSKLEKDFSVLGQDKSFVVEFDPPLVVPAAPEPQEML